MAKCLSDTTALINHPRGRQGRRLGICGSNLAELYSKHSLQERGQPDRLTDVLDCFQLDRTSAKGAGHEREESTKQSWTLTTSNALLAATAIAEIPP